MSKEEAWALLQACPHYFHDPEDGPERMILMNDVWGWAVADCFDLTDENVERVAQLYDRYGFCGLLYYQVEAEGAECSEFSDNNRFIQFVQNEERIRKETPGSNERAYRKVKYQIDGELK